MTTIKIQIDGKRYVGIPEEEYERLVHEPELLAPPVPDAAGYYTVKALDISMANQMALWRRAAGLTQKQLAEAAGVRNETISRFEADAHVPHKRTIDKLSAALETRLPWSEFLSRHASH